MNCYKRRPVKNGQTAGNYLPSVPFVFGFHIPRFASAFPPYRSMNQYGSPVSQRVTEHSLYCAGLRHRLGSAVVTAQNLSPDAP